MARSRSEGASVVRGKREAELCTMPGVLAYETAAGVLRKLHEAWQASAADQVSRRNPKALPLERVMVLPVLYQPRAGIDEHHIGQLQRVLKQGGDLDPVTVMRVGEWVVVVDGHHRVEAYRRDMRGSIPVRWFLRGPREALRECGAENNKAKLALTGSERIEHAWKLVRLTGMSKAEIATASGVSDGTVGNMRAVLEKLGSRAGQFTVWLEALREVRGNGRAMASEEDVEAWKGEQARDWSERLGKEFGTKMANNPEVAAMALSQYFGRRGTDVWKALGELVGEVSQDDGADDDVMDDRL